MPEPTGTPTALLPTPEIADLQGSIETPIGLPLETLVVETIANTASIDESGEFSLDAVRNGGNQLVILSDENDNTIGLSYLPLGSSKITITNESLALGLIRMYPQIWPLSLDDEAAVMEEAKRHQLFGTLKEYIAAALQDTPSLTLDPDANPEVLGNAMLIAFDAIEAVKGSENRASVAVDDEPVGNPYAPHLKNAEGRQITVVNPDFLFYGIEVDYSLDEDLFAGGPVKDVAYVIEGKGSKLNLRNIFTPPVEKQFPVAYGIMDIVFHKGNESAVGADHRRASRAGVDHLRY